MTGAALAVHYPAPAVEYLRGVVTACGCPRHVVGVDALHPLIVLEHRNGCRARHPRRQEAPPAPPKLALGVIPCPACGNVAFSLAPGGRRCDGPLGCGHIWQPRPVAMAGRED